MHKVCTKCGISKDIEDFYLRSDSKRRRSECASCLIASKKPATTEEERSKRAAAVRRSRFKYALSADGVASKTCSVCKEVKAVSDFHNDKLSPDGFVESCKPCRKSLAAKFYKANSERLKAQTKESAEQLKLEMIAAYGGHCVCCGETIPDFLTIDHIHGDGSEDKRAGLNSGRSLYCRLKREGFPRDRHQLLCMNCNFAKGKGKCCPHQTFATNFLLSNSQ